MIRTAQSKDIPQLLYLLGQVNLVHHIIRPDLFRRGTKYSREQLEEILRCPEDPVFVWEGEDGVIKGYLFAQTQTAGESAARTPVRTFYIDDLCVDENARGRGVGRELYQYALDYAKSKGFYNVTLHVWGGNDGARAFYEKLGMQVQYTSLEQIL